MGTCGARRATSSAISADQALLRSAYEFRGLLESFELRAMQKLGNIQQNDEPAFELAHAGDVARLPFRKKISRGLDLRRRDPQDLRSGIYDQAHQLIVQLDHQDAVLFVRLNLRLAKALAQVHHRNDLPAQVDHSFNRFRSAGHRGDLRNTDDLPHRTDADAERFVSDAKADDLEVFFHRCVPFDYRRASAYSISLSLRESFLRRPSVESRRGPPSRGPCWSRTTRSMLSRRFRDTFTISSPPAKISL